MIKNIGLSKRLFFIFGIFASTFLIVGISWTVREIDKDTTLRTIEFTEKISVPVLNRPKHLKIWIPVPTHDAYQHVKILNIDSPIPYRITQDKDFGNRLLYIEWKAPVNDQNINIKVLYNIARKERRFINVGTNGETSAHPTSYPISAYLKPRGLEAINEKIKGISEEITREMSDPLKKAKAIYDYVLKHMQYDKSGTGWGRGDSLYACDIGKGNCTDFHSLFIALARASQIPARFQMGIPLPEDLESEPSGSYHCWAEFYIEGKGWIPVDISEAWKNPKKSNYFFGNLDANRVLLSTGREILLSPRQEGAPLNYLSMPYIEIDGRQLRDFKLERRFKDKQA